MAVLMRLFSIAWIFHLGVSELSYSNGILAKSTTHVQHVRRNIPGIENQSPTQFTKLEGIDGPFIEDREASKFNLVAREETDLCLPTQPLPESEEASGIARVNSLAGPAVVVYNDPLGGLVTQEQCAKQCAINPAVHRWCKFAQWKSVGLETQGLGHEQPVGLCRLSNTCDQQSTAGGKDSGFQSMEFTGADPTPCHDPATNPCANGGICNARPTHNWWQGEVQYVCDCEGTGFSGLRCEMGEIEPNPDLYLGSDEVSLPPSPVGAPSSAPAASPAAPAVLGVAPGRSPADFPASSDPLDDCICDEGAPAWAASPGAGTAQGQAPKERAPGAASSGVSSSGKPPCGCTTAATPAAWVASPSAAPGQAPTAPSAAPGQPPADSLASSETLEDCIGDEVARIWAASPGAAPAAPGQSAPCRRTTPTTAAQTASPSAAPGQAPTGSPASSESLEDCIGDKVAAVWAASPGAASAAPGQAPTGTATGAGHCRRINSAATTTATTTAVQPLSIDEALPRPMVSGGPAAPASSVPLESIAPGPAGPAAPASSLPLERIAPSGAGGPAPPANSVPLKKIAPSGAQALDGAETLSTVPPIGGAPAAAPAPQAASAPWATSRAPANVEGTATTTTEGPLERMLDDAAPESAPPNVPAVAAPASQATSPATSLDADVPAAEEQPAPPNVPQVAAPAGRPAPRATPNGAPAAAEQLGETQTPPTSTVAPGEGETPAVAKQPAEAQTPATVTVAPGEGETPAEAIQPEEAQTSATVTIAPGEEETPAEANQPDVAQTPATATVAPGEEETRAEAKQPEVAQAPASATAAPGEIDTPAAVGQPEVEGTSPTAIPQEDEQALNEPTAPSANAPAGDKQFEEDAEPAPAEEETPEVGSTEGPLERMMDEPDSPALETQPSVATTTPPADVATQAAKASEEMLDPETADPLATQAAKAPREMLDPETAEPKQPEGEAEPAAEETLPPSPQVAPAPSPMEQPTQPQPVAQQSSQPATQQKPAVPPEQLQPIEEELPEEWGEAEEQAAADEGTIARQVTQQQEFNSQPRQSVQRSESPLDGATFAPMNAEPGEAFNLEVKLTAPPGPQTADMYRVKLVQHGALCDSSQAFQVHGVLPSSEPNSYDILDAGWQGVEIDSEGDYEVCFCVGPDCTDFSNFLKVEGTLHVCMGMPAQISNGLHQPAASQFSVEAVTFSPTSAEPGKSFRLHISTPVCTHPTSQRIKLVTKDLPCDGAQAIEVKGVLPSKEPATASEEEVNWDGIKIDNQGEYSLCYCFASDCTDFSHFYRLEGSISVFDGATDPVPKDAVRFGEMSKTGDGYDVSTVTFEPHAVDVSRSFSLRLNTPFWPLDVRAEGQRIRFINAGVECANAEPALGVHPKFVQSLKPVQDGVDYVAFSNLKFSSGGKFEVCYCYFEPECTEWKHFVKLPGVIEVGNGEATGSDSVSTSDDDDSVVTFEPHSVDATDEFDLTLDTPQLGDGDLKSTAQRVRLVPAEQGCQAPSQAPGVHPKTLPSQPAIIKYRKAVWRDLKVLYGGKITVCYCQVGDCTEWKHFEALPGQLVVKANGVPQTVPHGIEGSLPGAVGPRINSSPTSAVTGKPFHLQLDLENQSPSEGTLKFIRVKLAQGSDGEHCKDSEPIEVFPHSLPSTAPEETLAELVTEDGAKVATATWPNVKLQKSGQYAVCVCLPPKDCSMWNQFVPVGSITAASTEGKRVHKHLRNKVKHYERPAIIRGDDVSVTFSLPAGFKVHRRSFRGGHRLR